APAPETEPDPESFHEVGDLLFTVVNVARRLNVDPELALRATTRRFTRRVELAAELADASGEDWKRLDLDAQDAYYERAKESLAGRRPLRSPPASSWTRAATRPSRSTFASRLARLAAPRCPPAPRPASTKRWSCATVTRAHTSGRACFERWPTSTARS